MNRKRQGIFWKDWSILAEGEIELSPEEFLRALKKVLERDKIILESALRFVFDDINSLFYNDEIMYVRCASRIKLFGIENIAKLREFLEDPFPSKFTIDIDEAEIVFYKKAVNAAELFKT